jgi:hypothetical protein
MIKIEVKSGEVMSKTTKTGRPYRVQQAWAHLVGKDGHPLAYPVEMEMSYWDAADQPYPPGIYTLDPSSVYVGEFRRLSLGNLKLRPLTIPAQKVA